MDDPYLFPGTDVLANLFNAASAPALARAQGDSVFARLTQMRTQHITGAFNSAHLKAIHFQLFQDVYNWAGEYRLTQLLSNSHPTHQQPGLIDPAVKQLLDKLASEGRLRGLPNLEWVDRSSYYVDELSRIAPFRTGNGLAIREFARELALENGISLEWNRIDPGEYERIEKEDLLEGSNTNIRRVMLMALDPDPPSASVFAFLKHKEIEHDRERSLE